MKFILSGAALAVVLPMSVLAQTPSAESVLIEAFEANECRLMAGEARDALEAKGLGSDNMDVVFDLINAGQAQLGTEGKYVYYTGTEACKDAAPAAKPFDVPDAFITHLNAAFIERGGCELNDELAGDAFDSMNEDYTRQETEGYLGQLVNNGYLAIHTGSESRATLKIGADCGQ